MDTLEQEPTLKEVYVIDSEDKVNWVLSLLANLDAESARIKAQVETRQKQIANEKQSLLYQYEADLKAFAEKRLAEQGGRRKSVVLMQGTLAFRSVPESFKVADEAQAFAYTLQNSLDLTKAVLDKDAYRQEAIKTLQKTGELMPGVERTPEHTAFSIKFPKSGKEGEENGTTEE